MVVGWGGVEGQAGDTLTDYRPASQLTEQGWNRGKGSGVKRGGVKSGVFWVVGVDFPNRVARATAPTNITTPSSEEHS